MERYLYRGVNPELYQASNGKLIPKAVGRQFKCFIYHNGRARYGEGCTYGESETNAAIMHQKDSSKYSSSGVSTTPILKNAIIYATHRGKYEYGYVFIIDTALLEQSGVKGYIVSDYAVKPTIPGDKEVILVADNFGELPDQIIVKTIKMPYKLELEGWEAEPQPGVDLPDRDKLFDLMNGR